MDFLLRGAGVGTENGVVADISKGLLAYLTGLHEKRPGCQNINVSVADVFRCHQNLFVITEALRYSVILCSRAYGVNRTSEICYLKKDAGDWTLQDRKVI